jgi:pimeloyl-ACP methyl ester carboxylesterase
MVKINELRTYYESSGKGKSLILVHGAGGSSGYWGLQLAELSKQFRVISVDLPGHGKSERPQWKPTIEFYAQHVASLMKQLEIPMAAVLGHSMGGLVAQKLAVDYARKVEKLIIVDSGAKLVEQGVLPHDIDVQQAEVGMQILTMVLSHKTVSDKKKMAFVLKQISRNPTYDISILGDDLRAVASEDLRERLGEICSPTLIIHGADDPIPLAIAEYLRDNIRGSRLVVIPDSGHMPMLEQPERFNEALLGFLGE